jgi:hypothetical protein
MPRKTMLILAALRAFARPVSRAVDLPAEIQPYLQVHRRASVASPSLNPLDPESRYHDAA